MENSRLKNGGLMRWLGNKQDPAIGASWQLWENLARKSTAFGRPGNPSTQAQPFPPFLSGSRMQPILEVSGRPQGLERF